eukprot:g60766.t1
MWLRQFALGCFLLVAVLQCAHPATAQNTVPPQYVENYYPLREKHQEFIYQTPVASGMSWHTVISIALLSPHTVLLWDHWEDGYEVDPRRPLQSTRIWGDRNLSNGAPPLVSSDDFVTPRMSKLVIQLVETFSSIDGADEPSANSPKYDGGDQI